MSDFQHPEQETVYDARVQAIAIAEGTLPERVEAMVTLLLDVSQATRDQIYRLFESGEEDSQAATAFLDIALSRMQIDLQGKALASTRKELTTQIAEKQNAGAKGYYAKAAATHLLLQTLLADEKRTSHAKAQPRLKIA